MGLHKGTKAPKARFYLLDPMAYSPMSYRGIHPRSRKGTKLRLAGGDRAQIHPAHGAIGLSHVMGVMGVMGGMGYGIRGL
jgi:hypothetical protein